MVLVSPRSFAAGFLAGLLAVAVALGVLLLVVASPAGGPATTGPTTTPTSTGAGGSEPVGPDETWLQDVTLTSGEVRTQDGPLRDVTADGSGVRLTPDGLRAEELRLVATLPFETAAEQIGDDIELYAVGELAGLRRTVEILGRQVRIEATGSVQAVDGRLVIEPETVDLGSFEWIDRVASAAVRSFVTIRHTVTGIPDGLLLDTVEVLPDGFGVELSGSDVSIG